MFPVVGPGRFGAGDFGAPRYAPFGATFTLFLTGTIAAGDQGTGA